MELRKSRGKCAGRTAAGDAGKILSAGAGRLQALEDIAVTRVLPRMVVLSPCDATQTKIATEKAILELDCPVYIRFGREPVADFTPDDQEFQIGKAQVMKEGSDVCIIATGSEVWESLNAAQMLENDGISTMVVNSSRNFYRLSECFFRLHG